MVLGLNLVILFFISPFFSRTAQCIGKQAMMIESIYIIVVAEKTLADMEDRK